MINELIKTAYEELEKLKNEKPSWELYYKMSSLCASISYLQSNIKVDEKITTIEEIIDDMVTNIGESATIDFLKKLLVEMRKDMDCISPQLSACMLKKLKERYTKNV